MNRRTAAPRPPTLSWLLIGLLCGLAMQAPAATVYIRDQIYVPLRSGQSEEHRILHPAVPSGTPLELLETNEESGYSRIRTENGTEGWIQSQYLTEKPIARDQLRAAEQRYALLETELKEVRSQGFDNTKENAVLNDRNAELTRKNLELTTELSRITRLASDVVGVDEQNLALSEENKSLVAELDNLSGLNLELESRKQQEWFWLGAGTVLISVLLGIWIGRQIYFGRRPGSWS